MRRNTFIINGVCATVLVAFVVSVLATRQPSSITMICLVGGAIVYLSARLLRGGYKKQTNKEVSK